MVATLNFVLEKDELFGGKTECGMRVTLRSHFDEVCQAVKKLGEIRIGPNQPKCPRR